MKENYIGEKIKILRIKSGFTQQELANKIGVSWEMVSRYERGQSSPLQRIDAIAEAFNTTPGDLLQEDYMSSELNDAVSFFVPYFTKYPEKQNFTKENTHDHYTAPMWIIKNHPNSFAIDPNLLDSTTVQINATGPIFIEPSKGQTQHELHLVERDGKLLIVSKSNLNKADRIIGVVLAQELRFV